MKSNAPGPAIRLAPAGRKACLRLLGAAMLVSGAARAADYSEAPPQARDFLESWCIDCHDSGSKKGGLDLGALPWGGGEAGHARWVQVFDRVDALEMPPRDKVQPPMADRKGFLALLERDLTAQHSRSKGTALRRLNRIEYENTINDLLGTHLSLRQNLPEDPVAHGFDNLGEALGLSEPQLHVYLDTADGALKALLGMTQRPETKSASYKLAPEGNPTPPGPLAADKRDMSWIVEPDGTAVIFNDGSRPAAVVPKFRAPAAGFYRVAVTGRTHQADAPVRFALRAGSFAGLGSIGEPVAQFEFGAQSGTVQARVKLQAGDGLRLRPELSMDYSTMRDKGPRDYPGAGLVVESVEVEGPLLGEWPPRGQQLLLGGLLAGAKTTGDKRAPSLDVSPADPEADARRLLRGFAEAAFRRPANDGDAAPYVKLLLAEMEAGAGFTAALRTAAVAVLCAPDFLYLIEPPGRLDDYALAARLAYFLRRGPPDAGLLEAARQGRLRLPSVLRAETERLLGAPEAERFVADFTDAWLNLREITFTTPDPRLYPEFDLVLQESMLAETRAFLRELLDRNLSPLNIVKSDFAMLNSRLAEHYGIEGVEGMDIRRVALPAGSRRGGVLTQAAVLKVSANGVSTSPVIRGVFVLERVLGIHPPPPPPGVPGIEPDIRGAATMREMLEKHRESPQCAGCHQLIDPPGFALENYDAIGGWRERFRGTGEGEKAARKVGVRTVSFKENRPVDASGELKDGSKFTGFAQFQELLLSQPMRIHECVAAKLMTFATGREMGFSDRAELRRIARETTVRKGGLRDLVHQIVQSGIFLSK